TGAGLSLMRPAISPASFFASAGRSHTHTTVLSDWLTEVAPRLAEDGRSYKTVTWDAPDDSSLVTSTEVTSRQGIDKTPQDVEPGRARVVSPAMSRSDVTTTEPASSRTTTTSTTS